MFLCEFGAPTTGSLSLAEKQIGLKLNERMDERTRDRYGEKETNGIAVCVLVKWSKWTCHLVITLKKCHFYCSIKAYSWPHNYTKYERQIETHFELWDWVSGCLRERCVDLLFYRVGESSITTQTYRILTISVVDVIRCETRFPCEIKMSDLFLCSIIFLCVIRPFWVLIK